MPALEMIRGGIQRRKGSRAASGCCPLGTGIDGGSWNEGDLYTGIRPQCPADTGGRFGAAHRVAGRSPD